MSELESLGYGIFGTMVKIHVVVGLDTSRQRMKMFSLPFRGIETHQLVKHGIEFYIRRAHSQGAVDLWIVWWCYVEGGLLL